MRQQVASSGRQIVGTLLKTPQSMHHGRSELCATQDENSTLTMSTTTTPPPDTVVLDWSLVGRMVGQTLELQRCLTELQERTARWEEAQRTSMRYLEELLQSQTRFTDVMIRYTRGLQRLTPRREPATVPERSGRRREPP